MYVTPGPEIFSLECSHPLEGLITNPPPPPGLQSSPPGGGSSGRLFLPVPAAGSGCEQGVEEPPAPEAAAVAEPGLGPPEPPAPDPPPPCSLDTARSLTAEGRPLMPSRLPELLNFRPDTLLMRVQRVVPPSSRWSEPWPVGVLEAVVAEEGWTSAGGALGGGRDLGVHGQAVEKLIDGGYRLVPEAVVFGTASARNAPSTSSGGSDTASKAWSTGRTAATAFSRHNDARDVSAELRGRHSLPVEGNTPLYKRRRSNIVQM
ncbi:hypothetical protein EYF80_007887 [Liparis tanakae]|uniref:Uncharacterized protein n=1 Tax=Liparis tanakae TaxID=230148 RepID=A0A4Z2IW68_9TELE|nr:hypothetical protein EYF80_007887 [Liparis tanakae]